MWTHIIQLSCFSAHVTSLFSSLCWVQEHPTEMPCPWLPKLCMAIPCPSISIPFPQIPTCSWPCFSPFTHARTWLPLPSLCCFSCGTFCCKLSSSKQGTHHSSKLSHQECFPVAFSSVHVTRCRGGMTWRNRKLWSTAHAQLSVQNSEIIIGWRIPVVSTAESFSSESYFKRISTVSLGKSTANKESRTPNIGEKFRWGQFQSILKQ